MNYALPIHDGDIVAEVDRVLGNQHTSPYSKGVWNLDESGINVVIKPAPDYIRFMAFWYYEGVRQMQPIIIAKKGHGGAAIEDLVSADYVGEAYRHVLKTIARELCTRLDTSIVVYPEETLRFPFFINFYYDEDGRRFNSDQLPLSIEDEWPPLQQVVLTLPAEEELAAREDDDAVLDELDIAEQSPQAIIDAEEDI